MSFYLSLPILYLKFWFFEAPLGMFQFFVSLNNAFLQLFSFSLLIETFFKPLKNEYRDGLVGFSIAMGMVVKSVLLIFTFILLLLLFLIEFLLIGFFFLWPFALYFLLK